MRERGLVAGEFPVNRGDMAKPPSELREVISPGFPREFGFADEHKAFDST